MRRHRNAPSVLRPLCMFLSSWLIIAATTSAQSLHAMTVDEVIDRPQVSAPRSSPDGTRVIYTVSELARWKDNKRVTSM